MIFHGMRKILPISATYIVATLLAIGGSMQTASAETETDEQFYSLIFANWTFTDDWAASMQVETRFSNNDSDLQTAVFKPGIYYFFLPQLEFGVGYKYIDNTEKANEQNRLYFGYGWHVGKYWKIEIGYMWRYQRQRNGPNTSDNILRLQFLLEIRICFLCAKVWQKSRCVSITMLIQDVVWFH